MDIIKFKAGCQPENQRRINPPGFAIFLDTSYLRL